MDKLKTNSKTLLSLIKSLKVELEAQKDLTDNRDAQINDWRIKHDQILSEKDEQLNKLNETIE